MASEKRKNFFLNNLWCDIYSGGKMEDKPATKNGMWHNNNNDADG